MPESIAVAGFVNNDPCQLVHLSAGDARLCPVNAGSLCFQHNVIDLLHLFAGLSHADGTGHVAVIAVYHCTVIHQHKVAVLNDSLCRGYAVGHGGSTSCQCNGGERFTLGAVLHHGLVQAEHYVPFRDASPQEITDVRKGDLCDSLCLSNLVDLGFCFHCAARENGTAQGIALIQLHLIPQLLFQLGELAQGHGHRLHRQGAGVVFPEQFPNLFIQVVLFQNGAVFHAFPCFFNIPEINDQIRPVAEAEHCSRGGLHTGEIPAVDIRLDQSRIGSCRQLLHQGFHTLLHHDKPSPLHL